MEASRAKKADIAFGVGRATFARNSRQSRADVEIVADRCAGRMGQVRAACLS